MSQQELLRHVVGVLDGLGIDYMLTGSLASSWQGEPRSTHDIDLVIAFSPDAVDKLAQAFPPPDYYLSPEAMRDALRLGSMFNLLSLTDGEKVDFWLLTQEPFDQARFARKQSVSVLGMSLKMSAPEDTILFKLRWAKLSGGSEKQFTDALRIYEVQGTHLDLEYLKHWVGSLDVDDLWRLLLSQAEPTGE